MDGRPRGIPKKPAALLVSVLAFAAIALSPSDGRAQRSRRLERPYAARRVTLPRKTLRFDIGPFERGINDTGAINGPMRLGGYGFRILDVDGPTTGDDDLFVRLGLGMGFGILDELEVGALLVPAILAPDTDFGDMTAYVRFAFVNEDAFQMAIQGIFSFPTFDELGTGVGLPMNVNVEDYLRFELGIELEVIFYDDEVGADLQFHEDPLLALDVPIAITVNATDRGFVGARAALYVEDFDELVTEIGMHGGMTLMGRRRAYADLTGQFGVFLEEPTQRPEWELVFGANVYIGL